MDKILTLYLLLRELSHKIYRNINCLRCTKCHGIQDLQIWAYKNIPSKKSKEAWSGPPRPTFFQLSTSNGRLW